MRAVSPEESFSQAPDDAPETVAVNHHIPYAEVHDLLLGLDAFRPAERSLMKKGYVDGLVRMVRDANQVVLRGRLLRQAGHGEPTLVLYVPARRQAGIPNWQDPTGETVLVRTGTEKGPSQGEAPSAEWTVYEVKPARIEPQTLFEIPLPTPEPDFKLMRHVDQIAREKSPYAQLDRVPLAGEALAALKQGAAIQGFAADDPVHLGEYVHQLFCLMVNALDALNQGETILTVNEATDARTADATTRLGLRTVDPAGQPAYEDVQAWLPGFELPKASFQDRAQAWLERIYRQPEPPA